MQEFVSLATSTEAGAWVAALATLIAAANGITALTPTKADNNVLGIVLQILNWLSLNVYKNRNADDV
jgi:hypothetical protein